MKYYLTICAIVRNESQYIEEFIRFHLLHGVEHFFIYDNDSEDNTVEIIKDYPVTLNKISGPRPQLKAYQHCLDTYGKLSKWIAFTDCDEFLYGVDGRLNELLPDYEKFSAVAVNWIFFGSNGHLTKTEGLVIERFTKRAKEADRHVKTILQPKKTVGTGFNSHYFRLKNPAVNENKEKLPGRYCWTDPSVNIFRINHYHTKSKEEYIKRKSMPTPDGNQTANVENSFLGHDLNDVEDLSAAVYATLIK